MTADGMTASFVFGVGRQLDDVRQGVEAEGYEIAQTLSRKDGQPLASLLAGVDCDLLIADSTHAAQSEDFAAIGVLIRAHPSVTVIVLSESRDAAVLMAAMHAGVREVLPFSPSATELAAALRRMPRRGLGTTEDTAGGRVIAFMSCKGGSGATFLATNLGYMLATEHDKQTILIDLDLQYGDATYFMADAPAKSNIADLTRQIGRLDANLLAATLMQVTPTFGLLAAPEEPEEGLSITAAHLERVLDVARQNYDFVILDLDRKLDAVAIKALDKAELIFPVMQHMLPSVRNARRLVRAFRSLNYPPSKLRLIVNRYERRSTIDLPQLEEAVGLKVSYTIPNSYADVVESINTGVPLLKVNANNPVTRGLREIADELAEKPAPGARGWIGRLIRKQA
jgi:pilus assembly protein CpaE